MCPSNGTGMADHTFSDFSPTSDSYDQEINCLPSFGDSISDLISIGSPSMYLFPEETVSAENGCDGVIDTNQLEPEFEATLSQTGTGEDRTGKADVIPLTVLELDNDDTANTSSEGASLVTSLSGPSQRKRVRGGVRRSLPSPLSISMEPKGTEARCFSVSSPPQGPSLFCETGATEKVTSHSVVGQINDVKSASGSWRCEAADGNGQVKAKRSRCGNSGYQIATTAKTEAASSSEVPVWKLERRREQNRIAANRCRNKRKQEEDQLAKDFELTEKDNRLKRQEIQDLLSAIKRLNAELHRHTSTDRCFIQAPR